MFVLQRPTVPLILVVDDFSDALEIYQTYLTFKCYRVTTASSGAEAIATARAERPALILMDLRMVEMSGTEAMQADPPRRQTATGGTSRREQP